MSLSKVLTEDLLNNKKYNQNFLQYASNVSNEAYEKWSKPNATVNNEQFDWYIWPFKNGSSIESTATSEQNFDVELSVYSSFFSKVVIDPSYPLLRKYATYSQFKSGVISRLPSVSAAAYLAHSNKSSAIFCAKFSDDNYYFSGMCRPWFVA